MGRYFGLIVGLAQDLPPLKNSPHAMTVVGKDKSFTLLAADDDKKREWVQDLGEQIKTTSAADGDTWHGAWVDVEGVADLMVDAAGKPCKPFTVYNIKLQTSPKTPEKTIQKRFSEFHKLNSALLKKHKGAKLPDMPPKHIPRALRIGAAGNENVVDIRRVALDSYLQELIANVNLRHDELLQQFLEEDLPLDFERHEEASSDKPLASQLEFTGVEGGGMSAEEKAEAEGRRLEVERKLSELREHKEMLAAQIEFPEEDEDVSEQQEELEGVLEEIESLSAEVQDLARQLLGGTPTSGSVGEMARDSMAGGSTGGESGGTARELNAEAGDCGGLILIEKMNPGGAKIDKAAIATLMEGPGGVPDDSGLFDMLRQSDEWQCKWFVCQEGMMSIHESEEAWHRFESIAVIPTDLLKVSDPKAPRQGAPHAFRMEVDTSVKGSMSRVQIGTGFQQK